TRSPRGARLGGTPSGAPADVRDRRGGGAGRRTAIRAIGALSTTIHAPLGTGITARIGGLGALAEEPGGRGHRCLRRRTIPRTVPVAVAAADRLIGDERHPDRTGPGVRQQGGREVDGA